MVSKLYLHDLSLLLEPCYYRPQMLLVAMDNTTATDAADWPWNLLAGVSEGRDKRMTGKEALQKADTLA